MQHSNNQNVLILGGTNFMGKTLLDILAYEQPSMKVYCINRGRVYWDDEARTKHPTVEHYLCDRRDHTDFIKMIRFIQKKKGINQQNKWKCVIDFSAFKWRDVQSVIKGIQGNCQKYIFISTDSIYNNRSESVQLAVKESDFNIGCQYTHLRRNKINDKYGYNKLKCQLYLQKTKRIPYICLRLPDVIGPYDNTDRFWCCIQWINQSEKYSIPLAQRDEQFPLSFVYSKDVCKLIVQIMQQQLQQNEAYNICFNEDITLKQFLQHIHKSMETSKELKFKACKSKFSHNFYPSTEFGPIDCSKAKTQLHWNPTAITKSIQETTKFFVQKAHCYRIEHKDMLKQFKKKVILNGQ